MEEFSVKFCVMENIIQGITIRDRQHLVIGRAGVTLTSVTRSQDSSDHSLSKQGKIDMGSGELWDPIRTLEDIEN